MPPLIVVLTAVNSSLAVDKRACIDKEFGVKLRIGSVLFGIVFVNLAFLSPAIATVSFHGLGDLAGGSFDSSAFGVSADGSTIVGGSDSSSSGWEAFIWDTANGMQSLKDVLVNYHDLDLTGWTLSQAWGISDDGLTIVGHGYNPDGYTEAWVATIPEPATFVLFGLGGLFLRKRK